MTTVVLCDSGTDSLGRERQIVHEELDRFDVPYRIVRAGKDTKLKVPEGDVVLVGGPSKFPSGLPVSSIGGHVVKVPIIGKAKDADLTKGCSMTRKAAFIAAKLFATGELKMSYLYSCHKAQTIVNILNNEPKDALVWFDFETTGLDPQNDEIVLIAVSIDSMDDTTMLTNGDIEPLMQWLATSPNPKGVCGATFEIRWFLHRKQTVNITEDVQVDHCLLHEEDYRGLSQMAGLVDMWGYDLEMDKWKRTKKPIHEAPQAVLNHYAAGDVVCTRALSHKMAPMLSAQPSKKTDEVKQWLIRGQHMLSRVMVRGLKVNVPHLQKVVKETDSTVNRLTYQLQKIASECGMEDFNPGSAPQRSKLLYDELGVPCLRKTKAGGRSTGEEALTALNSDEPAVKAMLEIASLLTVKSGVLTRCVEAVNDGDGFMRTNLDLTKLVTGQLSSTQPPMQNVSSEMRALYHSRHKGGLMSEYDYSQLHLRVMGNLSQCEGFIDAYERGIDLHCRTVAGVITKFSEDVVLRAIADGDTKMQAHRDLAKRTNFSIIFEIGSRALAEKLHKSVEECKRIIVRFFDKYPEVKEQIERQHAFARRYGYVVSPMGRVRHLPNAKSLDKMEYLRAMRQSGDFLVSNSGRYITLYAMIMMDEYMTEKKMRSEVVMQTHDSILIDTHPKEVDDVQEVAQRFMVDEISKYVESWMTPIPLVVDGFAGTTWSKKDKTQEMRLI